jgi:hypothetical protein
MIAAIRLSAIRHIFAATPARFRQADAIDVFAVSGFRQRHFSLLCLLLVFSFISPLFHYFSHRSYAQIFHDIIIHGIDRLPPPPAAAAIACRRLFRLLSPPPHFRRFFFFQPLLLDFLRFFTADIIFVTVIFLRY